MEPKGEVKEREIPAHLETHENGRIEVETSYVEQGKRPARNRVRWSTLVKDLCST